MIVLIKKTAAGLYIAPQLFWENSDEREPGPLIIVWSREPAFS